MVREFIQRIEILLLDAKWLRDLYRKYIGIQDLSKSIDIAEIAKSAKKLAVKEGFFEVNKAKFKQSIEFLQPIRVLLAKDEICFHTA